MHPLRNQHKLVKRNVWTHVKVLLQLDGNLPLPLRQVSTRRSVCNAGATQSKYSSAKDGPYMNTEQGYEKFISRKKLEHFIEKKLGHSDIGVRVL